MPKKVIIANWKMYLSVDDTAGWWQTFESHFKQKADEQWIIAPSFTSLDILGILLEDRAVQLAGQNMHPARDGAFTGEISGDFLIDLGCRYVLLGHSERRQFFNEDDVFLAKKLRTALDLALIPIYCIGESEADRDSGVTFDKLDSQLQPVIEHLPEMLGHKMEQDSFILAYEPVWAIGTGKVATPEQAEEVHAWLRQQIEEKLDPRLAEKIQIVYGGSVKRDNASRLIAQEHIDGLLVGSASLDPIEFAKLLS